MIKTNPPSAPTHCFMRQFKPEKTHPPRGFVKPSLQPSKAYFLEIGAGKGMHALEFAKSQPEHTLFAIERTKEKFAAFDKLAKAQCLPNLYAIHADAIAWTVHALPPRSLAGVFILYPNPEPRNSNQRWHNMPFFEFLLSRMKRGAKLSLASNIERYINEANEAFAQLWCLPVTRSALTADSRRSHFEVKYMVRGERCWQLDVVKPAGYVTRFDDCV